MKINERFPAVAMPIHARHQFRFDPDPEGGGGEDEAAAREAAEAAAKAAEEAARKKVTDEEARLLKENMKKKEELAKARAELDAAAALKAQLEELGGLDALKALVTKAKDEEAKALEAKGDFERLKARMAEEHAKEKKSLSETLTQKDQALAQALAQIDELTIGSAFATSGFIKENLTLTPTKARVIYGTHFDLVDGQVVGFDKPRGAAGRTAFVDGSGNPVDFSTAISKIVEADPDKDTVLRDKTKPGAGSASKRTAAPAKKEEVSAQSKIESGLKGLGLI